VSPLVPSRDVGIDSLRRVLDRELQSPFSHPRPCLACPAAVEDAIADLMHRLSEKSEQG